VDNTQIENVLGRIECQPPALKRRMLLSNGIATRHYAIDPATGAVTHTNAQLTAEAIRDLARRSGFSTDQIECLACGTSSADQVIPGHVSMVHAELGCPPCETVSPSGVCCAGVSALKFGYLSVLAGTSSNAVVTGSELASPTLRASHFEPQLRLNRSALEDHALLPFSNEFLRWMLSDGAGALLISHAPSTHGPSLQIDWVDVVSYAHQSDVCMHFGLQKKEDGTVESYRTVDGERKLFRDGFVSLAQDVRVLNDRLPVLMRTAIAGIVQRRRLEPEKVDWLLPHYSSQFFRQRLHDGLAEIGFEIPSERWFSNLTTKGNTGSAAIYIMLEEFISTKAKSGDRVLCIVPESSRMLFGLIHLTVV
jgi:3-oxoacyl-[acyl-carrier-protein] synthase-3